MRARFHETVQRFLAAAEGFLRSDPLSTNVVAVVAARVAAGAQPASDDHLWATLEDGDGGVLGLAMHTPPHALFVSRMPAVGTRPQRVTTHYHIIPGDQSSTSWSAAVPTLLAVIVGGLISLFGVWLKDARDKRRAVQEWVEEEFVFGGIEPVIRTLDRVRLILLQREVSLVRVEPVGDFPVTELAKLRIIIGSDGLSAFIQVLGRLAMRATENGRRRSEARRTSV